MSYTPGAAAVLAVLVASLSQPHITASAAGMTRNSRRPGSCFMVVLQWSLPASPSCALRALLEHVEVRPVCEPPPAFAPRDLSHEAELPQGRDRTRHRGHRELRIRGDPGDRVDGPGQERMMHLQRGARDTPNSLDRGAILLSHVVHPSPRTAKTATHASQSPSARTRSSSS